MVLKIKHNTVNKVKLTISDWLVLAFILFGIGRTTWSGYRMVLMLIGIAWIFFVLPSFTKLYQFKDKSVVVYLGFMLLYSVFMLLSSDIGLAVNYLGSYFLYFILLLMFNYYVHTKKLDKLERICKVCIGWICLLCIFAILYYKANPGAARLYATHRSNLDGYMIGGGYHLAYICAALLPIFVLQLLHKKTKLIHIVAAVLMIVLIYETTSVITMVAAVIGCFVSLAFAGERKRIIISFSVAIGVIVVFLLTKQYIGQLLIDIAGGRRVTSFSDMNNATFVRMTEIGQMFKGLGISSGTAMQLRIENYTRPLSGIIERPLTGCIFTTGVCPELSSFNDSTIITALSCWGIPMGCMFLYPVFDKMKDYKTYIGSAVVIALLLLLNPSDGFSIYAGAFFLLPSLHLLMAKNNKK